MLTSVYCGIILYRKEKQKQVPVRTFIVIKQAIEGQSSIFFVSEILVHFADSRQSYSGNRQHKPKQQNEI